MHDLVIRGATVVDGPAEATHARPERLHALTTKREATHV